MLGATTTTVVCVVPGFLVGGLAVQIGDELRFGPAGLGVAVSTYFAVSAVTSVPAGRIVGRFGPTRTARAGILVAAASLAAVGGLARDYGTLVALLAVAGVANALGQLASNASLAARVPPKRQGLSFGVKQAAIPLSTLLAGLAVPAVALTIGWRWGYAMATALALAALLLVPRDETNGRQRRREPRTHGSTGALVVVGFATLLAASAANSLSTFVVDAAVAGGLHPGPAGLALSAGSAACITFRLLGGWLADKRTGGHMTVLAVLLGIGAVGLVLIGRPGLATLWTGVLLAFGIGWSWPGLLNYAVVQLHPQAPAAATSITQTGVYAGACVGPLVFGTVATANGYPVAWLGAAGTMLLAGVGMLVGGALLRRSAPGSARPVGDHVTQ